MLLSNRKVFVGKFVSRKEREKELGEKAKMFTNVYINNFGEQITDEVLETMFTKYGPITSCKVMNNYDGKSLGFGFVSFEDPESAEKACKDLNGKELEEGKALYVGRAQKRGERQQELKRKFEQLKMDHLNRYQGVNLYVKNLDDSVDEETLRKEFAPFGTITSAKVRSNLALTKHHDWYLCTRLYLLYYFPCVSGNLSMVASGKLRVISLWHITARL